MKKFEYVIYNDRYLTQELFLIKENNNIKAYTNCEPRNIKYILEEEETSISEFTREEYVDTCWMDLCSDYTMRQIVETKVNKYGFSENDELKEIEKEILLITSPSYMILKCKIQDIIASI